MWGYYIQFIFSQHITGNKMQQASGKKLTTHWNYYGQFDNFPTELSRK